MKVSYSEPCFSGSVQSSDYCYNSNWNSSYYSLDTKEHFHEPFITACTSVGFSYQPEPDEEISNDLLPFYKIRPASVEDWDSRHIMSWIIELYNNEGFSYEPVNMHLLRNCTGKDLLKFPESKFYEIHERYAKWLYRKVRELAIKSDPIRIDYGDSTTYRSFENLDNPLVIGSDCEEHVKPKKRGRPKSLNKIRRKSEHKTGKLWEFLRDLLLNPEYCPSLICWENHDEGVFRFVSSDKVAKIWGSKRGNSEMNYEKLSRAMRYYYKNKVLLPVLGKRLVYKFGPKAVGWRTNNPNFEL